VKRPPRTFGGHDVTCRDAVQLMNDYLDDQLGHDDRARLEAHLGECDHCTDHLAHMRTAIAVTGRLREEDLHPSARDDMMEVYRRWRRDAVR
jgi:anti-sigma factor RsiW